MRFKQVLGLLLFLVGKKWELHPFIDRSVAVLVSFITDLVRSGEYYRVLVIAIPTKLEASERTARGADIKTITVIVRAEQRTAFIEDAVTIVVATIQADFIRSRMNERIGVVAVRGVRDESIRFAAGGRHMS